MKIRFVIFNIIVIVRMHLSCKIIIDFQMQEASRQFKQIIRTYAIRSVQISREKGMSVQVEQSQQSFIKILQSSDLHQAVIGNITSLDLKTDFHQILLLALLQQLAKWSIQHYQAIKPRPAPIQILLSRAISLIQSQQKFHSIVSKQIQLISNLLLIPYTVQNIEYFKNLYKKLKDVKDYYPSSVKDTQRIIFSKTIQQVISIAIKLKTMNIIQFLHTNICTEIDFLQEGSDLLPSRLKILKKIMKSIQQRHQQIQKRTAYVVLKLSHNILNFPFLFGHLISLYEIVLQKFIRSDSLVPMILLEHVVIQNLAIAQSNTQYLFINILLNQLSTIFTEKYFDYFLKLYDWNFMAEGTCRKVIHLVFSYTEDRSNQKKPQYQFYKKCLKRMMESIQAYIGNINDGTSNQERQKFYFVKKREYDDIIELMNNSPKKILKKLTALVDNNEKENLISKYVHILRRSAHLQKKSMIQIMAADNKCSREIFDKYIKTLMAFCQSYDLQEFMRHFISNFFLSGQGQQVERTIDHLTQYFYKHQKQEHAILKNSDVAYTFANAIIILNSDLHNPKNERKMTEEDFIKMCKKINAGQDLPKEIVKETYKNIKNNQIHTYRDVTALKGISYKNWTILIQDPEVTRITYYDQQMNVLEKGCFETYVKNMLLNIVNQKQDKKLSHMVQRFDYDQKNFQCQIVEDLRKAIHRRPELPTIVLQKIYEQSNFRNAKVNDRIISYYWLAVKIIENFSQKIHPKKICEILILTWKIRTELSDHLYTRQKIQIRKIKNCLKQIESRGSRKSIMDIFSNFLSKQDSDQQNIVVPKITKKINYQNFGLNIMQVLQNLTDCKKQAIQYLISYLRNNQSKIFQQFMSVLSLIMHLVHTSTVLSVEYIDLFEELLQIKDSQLSKRVSSLKQKDEKKYLLLNTFSRYWILRICFKKFPKMHISLLEQTVSFIQVADRILLVDILNELKTKEIPQQIVSLVQKNANRITTQQQIQWFLEKYPIKEKQSLQKNGSKESKEQNIQKQIGNKQTSSVQVIKQQGISVQIRQVQQNKQLLGEQTLNLQVNQGVQSNQNNGGIEQTVRNESQQIQNQSLSEITEPKEVKLQIDVRQQGNQSKLVENQVSKDKRYEKEEVYKIQENQLGNQNLEQLLKNESQISLPFYML